MLVAIVFPVVVGALLGLCAMYLIRNELVYRYRKVLLEDMSRGAQIDIEAGRPWYWRYEAYDSVTYSEMGWQFWRRFDSFYPDQSFRRSA